MLRQLSWTKLRALVVLLLVVPTAASAAETVRVANRDELALALRDPQPGTTILIAPGAYRGGLSAGRLRGTQEQPIVVAGEDSQHPPVIEGGGGGLHLSSPEHVELRDLVFSQATGNGLNIDDGGSAETPAHNLLLKNLVIHDVGPKGNRDGIKLSGVNDFRVVSCRLERWGSDGSAIDMVGCQRGEIYGSAFLDAANGANGVQAKGGSRAIAIRRCRFENAGGRAINIGGSTGLAFFRPSTADFEAKDITVEDCEILGGLSAIAFVGCDGALVQHNTIYCPTRWPLRILQENTDPRFVPCREGVFKNNVVAFRASEVRQVINVSPSTAPETFRFSGNHWQALDMRGDVRRLLRLPLKETDGVYNEPLHFKDPENGDVTIASRTPEQAGVRPKP